MKLFDRFSFVTVLYFYILTLSLFFIEIGMSSYANINETKTGYHISKKSKLINNNSDSYNQVKRIVVGMGPSHIIASPDPMFTSNLDQWSETLKAIDAYKFNWKQLEPEKHTDQPKHTWGELTPRPFVVQMQKHNIKILSEFNQFHYAVLEEDIAAAAAKIVVEGHKPFTSAGGKLHGLSVDGMFRILTGGIFTGKQSGYVPVPLETASQILSDFIEEIHTVWPECRVGWTVNLPNWRYSKEFDYFDGSDFSTRMGGLYFMDALESFQKTLASNDQELGYLEVDYPYNYFQKNIKNSEKFRHLQSWCRQNEIPFHLVVNTHANKKSAKVFYDGVMKYLEKLTQENIQPDMIMIQSWYEEPKKYVPDTEKYTMTNTVRDAMRWLLQQDNGGK